MESNKRSPGSISSGDTSIIGGYGSWAAGIAEQPSLLSFRNPQWSDLSVWREKALAKTKELIAAPFLDKKELFIKKNEFNLFINIAFYHGGIHRIPR